MATAVTSSRTPGLLEHGLDIVIAAHGHAAGDEEGVPSEAGSGGGGEVAGIVGGKPQTPDREPQGSATGGDHVAVGVPDLRGPRPLGPRVPEFVAGGEHGDPGPPADLHPDLADGGEEPHARRRDPDAGLEELRTPHDLGAAGGDPASRRDGGRRLSRSRPDDEVSVANRVFHHDRGVRPFRQRGARHDGRRFPRAQRDPRHRPRGDLIHNPQPAPAREAGGADGIPVNRRAVEGRQVPVREHVFPEHPAAGLSEPDRLGRQAGRPREDPAKRFLDRNQGRLDVRRPW